MSAARVKTAAPPTYADQIGQVLQMMFSGCRERVLVEGRSLYGFGERQLVIPPPYEVPVAIFDLLTDGWGLRISVATRTAGKVLSELPVLFAVWQPAHWFNSPLRRHEIRAEAQAAVAEALTRMPPPTVLIDGAHTVWGAWALERPLSLTSDRTLAEQLQRQLAGLVGSDPNVGTMLHALLPFAGVIRNWNVVNREWTRLAVAQERRYRIDELLQTEEVHR